WWFVIRPRRVDQGRTRGLHARVDALGQYGGISFAGDDRLENRTTALTDDVGEHRADFEVRVLENLLDPLNVSPSLTDQLLAGARECPHLLDGDRWHEATTHQAVRQEVGDPRGIVHIG